MTSPQPGDMPRPTDATTPTAGPAGPASAPMTAALWMLGSIASFSAMAVAGRAVSGLHDTFEIMLWRSLIGWLIVTGVALSLGRLAEVRTRRIGEHVVRNLFHFAGQNLWFWALTMIPLAQVFALEFTSPIWVILLSPMMLGERITRARMVAASLGFIGVLLVARPDPTALNPGVLAAAGCAIGFAVSIIMTRALARKGESIIGILFWLTALQFLYALVLAGLDGHIALPNATTLPWLALIGLAGIFAHFCLTRALSLAPASFVVPIDFARLPVIAVVGMLLYGERLDPAVLIGATIIFLGNWVNIRAETKKISPKGTVAES